MAWNVPSVLEDAEQVVEPVVEGVRVALDVEEQVARRRRRQRGQAALGLDLARGRRAGAARTEPRLAPSLELDPRLLADPHEARALVALERRRQRQRQLAERLERRDAALGQAAPLARGDPGHELRWSSARRRAGAPAAQRQTSQCSTGSG